MQPTTPPTIFISYSRRQLYFAESLALYLQKESLDIWFDLQQLQAGTVWEDGLKEGINKADTLILIVSQASLVSPYVTDEWKAVAKKGNQLVLVVYESVELPEELHGLPTYDFRNGFNKKLRELTAYLKAETEPSYDKVTAPNLLRDIYKMPYVVLRILFTHFSAFIICVVGLSLIANAVSFEVLLAVIIFSFMVGLRFGTPLVEHKQSYRKTKRSILLITLLVILELVFGHVLFISYLGLNKGENSRFFAFAIATIAVIVFNLSVYYRILSGSVNLLRWMEPEDGLQKMRRRLHQPLISKEIFDLDSDAKKRHNSILYTLHNDPADRPRARWIAKIFKNVGYQQVAPSENPKYHIAILSNRSSLAKVQELIRSYAGKLIFVVVSTIEFTDELKEIGRYQWVDARGVDKYDIIGLAKSLADETVGKDATLKSTPDRIDRWKIPSGIKLLRAIFMVFGMTCFALIAMMIVFFLGAYSSTDDTLVISFFLNLAFWLIAGIGNFWLVTRGILKRRIPAVVMYGSALLNLLPIILILIFLPENRNAGLLLFILAISLLAFLTRNGWVWLPAFAKKNHDEIGINKVIFKTYRRKRIRILVVVFILMSSLGIYLQMSS